MSDDSKHRYELVPIVKGVHEYPYRLVGSWTSESTGEKRSVGAAIELMADRPDVERVHVYHTHPSPGPVRRYLGIVGRGDARIRYAQA